MWPSAPVAATPSSERADVRVVEAGQRLPDGVAGHLGQSGPGVAPVPMELALDQSLHVGAVLRGEPSLTREDVGQRPFLLAYPQRAAVDELGASDRVDLKREDPEQKVAIWVEGGHD